MRNEMLVSLSELMMLVLQASVPTIVAVGLYLAANI